MEICVVHGSARNGNTEKTIEIIKSQLNKMGQVSYSDIYLPKDLPEFCIGCSACLLTGDYGGQNCPHNQHTHPIMEKLRRCDGFVITSPCYALAETAQVKSLLDHLACTYISHRPSEEMFQKVAFIISTTGWAGAARVISTIKRSVLYWGVKRVITCKITMESKRWADMPKRTKIETKLRKKTAQFYRFVSNREHLSRGLSSAILHSFVKRIMSAKPDDDPDKRYWKLKNWI